MTEIRDNNKDYGAQIHTQDEKQGALQALVTKSRENVSLAPFVTEANAAEAAEANRDAKEGSMQKSDIQRRLGALWGADVCPYSPTNDLVGSVESGTIAALATAMWRAYSQSKPF
jgi:hypothetical protein